MLNDKKEWWNDESRKLIVQKSNPLAAIWNSPLTLSDLKIFDAYLSRINSHDPENRSIRFEKGELEALIGVKKINASSLKTRLEHLGTMIRVSNPEDGDRLELIALMQKIYCEKDKSGVWIIELTCTPEAMKYIFNIKNIGYLRYGFRNIAKLTSIYSYKLFIYLEKNRGIHDSWVVGLDELRMVLNATSDYYDEFKHLNQKILIPAHDELCTKTQCNFAYVPVRRSRVVVGIMFMLGPLDSSESVAVADTAYDGEYDDVEWDKDEAQISFLGSACNTGGDESEFSREEMQEIFQALVLIPDDKLPICPTNNTIEFRRYHYLAQMYAAMNRVDKRKKIKNRFLYFLSSIKSDAKRFNEMSG